MLDTGATTPSKGRRRTGVKATSPTDFYRDSLAAWWEGREKGPWVGRGDKGAGTCASQALISYATRVHHYAPCYRFDSILSWTSSSLAGSVVPGLLSQYILGLLGMIAPTCSVAGGPERSSPHMRAGPNGERESETGRERRTSDVVEARRPEIGDRRAGGAGCEAHVTGHHSGDVMKRD